jgi:hypothetical protein
MSIRSNLFLPRESAAALVLAASVLSLGATSAKAQFLFNWDRTVPPMEVERMVEASGYRLTGPVMRRGPVYLANVLGRDNDRERLVIDARDGRLLQRYGAEERRQYAASDDWSSRPRPRNDTFDGGFERDDDGPAPRPPAEVYGDSGQLLHGPFVRPAPQGSQVARAEDPAGRPDAAVDSSDPYVLLAPPDVGHTSDKAKPKPQAKHKKPDATPVAQPAANPADAKPAPVAAQPPANPQPANPQAAVSPEAATPAAPAPGVAAAKPEPSNPRPAANPQAAITPPVATPARPVSARPSTPAPRVADIKQEPLGTQRSANPPAAITPPVAMPARPVVSAHQSTPATPAPRVADTKPVAAPAPETAAAAPPAKPTRPKPVLNDVPVAPLE